MTADGRSQTGIGRPPSAAALRNATKPVGSEGKRPSVVTRSPRFMLAVSIEPAESDSTIKTSADAVSAARLRFGNSVRIWLTHQLKYSRQTCEKRFKSIARMAGVL